MIPANSKTWFKRAILCFALFFVIAAGMAPVSMTPFAIPSPDLVFCLIAAWLVRRPDLVSAAVIVAAVLTAEIFLLQTPGLWSAIVLLASEYLRASAERVCSRPFLYEWLLVAAVYVASAIAYQFFLALTFLPAPSPEWALVHGVETLLAYPLVVAVTNLLFRVTKPGPDDSGMFSGIRTARWMS